MHLLSISTSDLDLHGIARTTGVGTGPGLAGALPISREDHPDKVRTVSGALILTFGVVLCPQLTVGDPVVNGCADLVVLYDVTDPRVLEILVEQALRVLDFGSGCGSEFLFGQPDRPHAVALTKLHSPWRHSFARIAFWTPPPLLRSMAVVFILGNASTVSPVSYPCIIGTARALEAGDVVASGAPESLPGP